jgi:hypothetical protein|tara:strand:+ start:692 stop:796 length:105 start_codon:yes stop_codon:yes gene_type:complete
VVVVLVVLIMVVAEAAVELLLQLVNPFLQDQELL